jgi:hypothetical protein
MNPQATPTLFLTKVPKTWRKDSLSTNVAGKSGYLPVENQN